MHVLSVRSRPLLPAAFSLGWFVLLLFLSTVLTILSSRSSHLRTFTAVGLSIVISSPTTFSSVMRGTSGMSASAFPLRSASPLRRPRSSQNPDYTETLCGTGGFMAPEIWSRRYSYQCDIWSLCITFHVMLLGRVSLSLPLAPRVPFADAAHWSSSLSE